MSFYIFKTKGFLKYSPKNNTHVPHFNFPTRYRLKIFHSLEKNNNATRKIYFKEKMVTYKYINDSCFKKF